MTDIELKIELKIGPATIMYEAPEGAELFHLDEAQFIQKVMDLMKYVGTPDAPPYSPTPSPLAPQTVRFESSDTEELITSMDEPNDMEDFFPDDDEDGSEFPQGRVVAKVAGIKEVRAS